MSAQLAPAFEPESPVGEMISGSAIARIVGYRDAAVAKMQEAVEAIARGHELAEEARALAAHAHAGTGFHHRDRSQEDAYARIFQRFDAAASGRVYREHTDAAVWMHLIETTGLRDLMDAQAKDEFYDQLCTDPPPVTEEMAYGMFEALRKDAKLIFQRGLAKAFSALDRRFKSHDAFKLGSRIILTGVFDAYGHWHYGSRTADAIDDIERVFAVLDGKRPRPGELRRAVTEGRHGRQRQQSLTETDYCRVRGYLNGNAHFWFTRDDLVEKANLQLAEYYGEVLPDAAPRDAEPDIRTGGVLAKNLSFYATPPAVVHSMLQDVWVKPESRVLEPSAGTGAIARELLAKGARVDAIEVDFERCAALRAIAHPRLSVTCANFLRQRPRPEYTHVVMNPPFYGTHWMEHVTHAFEFLAPGGVLVAVLPVTAELGETRKHVAFRKWATERSRDWRGLQFHDLPPESFASSGTRVNTVTLTLHRSDR